MLMQAPSLANLNILEFGSKVQELIDEGIRMFHVDLMDAHYVPSLCLPPWTVKNLKEKYPDAVVEVHMMVDDPMSYIDQMREYGADYLSFHIDSTSFVRRTLTCIKNAGMKAGVVMNPSQQIEILEPFAGLLDYVVFMSVEPGFAGQRFLDGSIERLKRLSDFREENHLEFQIFIDGGVDYENLPQLIRWGADVVVTGIYVIFQQPDGIPGARRRFDESVRNVVEKGVSLSDGGDCIEKAGDR